ncbi:MAG: thioredoxin domain-containing protein, partial [Alphaproteobacteria bacterium]
LVDWRHGGMGGAPKFPHTGMLMLLWRAWWRQGDVRYRDAVLLALRHMAQGGIYDHLGGGFSRYAVDERWLVPHFEKMLYDNALMIELYTLVWAQSRHPLLAQRVEETIGWVGREMLVDGGGFAASLDADSDGEEGRFYVWDAAEILDSLGAEDARFFGHVYDVTPSGNWDGKVILNRLNALEPLDDDDERRLARCRATLLEARARRIRPGRDDKTLADWSALMVAALARAAMVFGRRDWLDLAQTAFDFVCTHMDAGDGRLYHSYRAGRAGAAGLLEDYGAMGVAACHLHMATGKADYLARAMAWADIIEAQFADPRGGYCQTAADGERLIARPRPVQDHATPSGNGLAAQLLVLLHRLSGTAKWQARAAKLFAAFGGEVARNFFGLATLLAAFEDSHHPVDILLAGDIDHAMLETAWRHAPPGAIIQRLRKDTPLAPDHPGAAIDRCQAAAHVCAGMTCSLPLGSAEALAAHLEAMHGWQTKT